MYVDLCEFYSCNQLQKLKLVIYVKCNTIVKKYFYCTTIVIIVEFRVYYSILRLFLREKPFIFTMQISTIRIQYIRFTSLIVNTNISDCFALNI